ncbi:MAG: chalcone isomerase family protein, partial [Rhodoferax sp.]|nr:chalcone isomerase family protein [Rhodoferax sp.]
MKSTTLIASVLCLAALVAPWAGAATLEGLRFEDSTRLANSELRLNGLGVRAVFIIKGYVAGLYLNEKAATLQEVAAMPGPKRLQLRMLRSAGPDDFNSA